MKATLSVIKADVGSIGGHTRPSSRMLDTVQARVGAAIERQLLEIDCRDIGLIERR